MPSKLSNFDEEDTSIAYYNDIQRVEDGLATCTLVVNFRKGEFLHSARKHYGRDIGRFYNKLGIDSSYAYRYISFYKLCKEYPMILTFQSISFSQIFLFREKLRKKLKDDINLRELLQQESPEIQVFLISFEYME